MIYLPVFREIDRLKSTTGRKDRDKAVATVQRLTLRQSVCGQLWASTGLTDSQRPVDLHFRNFRIPSLLQNSEPDTIPSGHFGGLNASADCDFAPVRTPIVLTAKREWITDS